MAFQNIIFKEYRYLNLIYKNGQNYEIIPFLMVFVNFYIHFQIPVPYGSGSGTLELRIRIRQKFRILADPDPQHCFELPVFTKSGEFYSLGRILIRFFSEVGSGSGLTWTGSTNTASIQYEAIFCCCKLLEPLLVLVTTCYTVPITEWMS
jgi:hypothetical protein